MGGGRRGRLLREGSAAEEEAAAAAAAEEETEGRTGTRVETSMEEEEEAVMGASREGVRDSDSPAAVCEDMRPERVGVRAGGAIDSRGESGIGAGDEVGAGPGGESTSRLLDCSEGAGSTEEEEKMEEGAARETEEAEDARADARACNRAARSAARLMRCSSRSFSSSFSGDCCAASLAPPEVRRAGEEWSALADPAEEEEWER